MKIITVFFTVFLLPVSVTIQYKNRITLFREDICSKPVIMRESTR